MASGSILNNVSALGASRQLGITGAGLEQTLKRLTTGKRINQASDDAAGLAISNRLGADIRIAVQARRNAYDGIAMLQVADGTLDEVTNLLTRAAELSQQSRTGTVSDTNRQAIDLEFKKIISTISDLNKSTTFNGASVFGTKEVVIAIAGFTEPTVTVGTIGALDGNLLKAGDAKTAEENVQKLIQSVSMLRASIGASQQTLNSYANTLGIQVENFTAAFAQIRDANIADEVVNLTKFQILNQSGTSALGQANMTAQSVLALLR